MLGDAEVVLTGGAESMSQSPHVIRGIRFGIPFGREQLVHSWHYREELMLIHLIYFSS